MALNTEKQDDFILWCRKIAADTGMQPQMIPTLVSTTLKQISRQIKLLVPHQYERRNEDRYGIPWQVVRLPKANTVICVQHATYASTVYISALRDSSLTWKTNLQKPHCEYSYYSDLFPYLHLQTPNRAYWYAKEVKVTENVHCSYLVSSLVVVDAFLRRECGQ